MNATTSQFLSDTGIVENLIRDRMQSPYPLQKEKAEIAMEAFQRLMGLVNMPKEQQPTKSLVTELIKRLSKNHGEFFNCPEQFVELRDVINKARDEALCED